MRNHILTVLLSLIFIPVVQAQKYSNEFLNIGIGARAQGMGNAVCSIVDDVTAGYWNPAGLAFSGIDRGVQVGAMHNEWFAGIGKSDFLGLTLPIGNQTQALGFSIIRFGIDNIPNTLSLYEDDGTINYNNITEFSAADYAFIGSFAQKVGKLGKESPFSVGGNVKIIHREIGSFASSWGFGLDLGIQYRKKNWNFGIMARDITTTFNAWSFTFKDKEKEKLLLTGNEIPINSIEKTLPQLILSASYQRSFGKIGGKAALDLFTTTDGKRNTLISSSPFSIAPAIGLELDYNKLVFARAGIGQFQKQNDFNGSFWTSRPSVGIGLKLFRIKLDYALSDVGDTRNKTYSHIISLIIHIKPKRDARFD